MGGDWNTLPRESLGTLHNVIGRTALMDNSAASKENHFQASLQCWSASVAASLLKPALLHCKGNHKRSMEVYVNMELLRGGC